MRCLPNELVGEVGREGELVTSKSGVSAALAGANVVADQADAAVITVSPWELAKNEMLSME